MAANEFRISLSWFWKREFLYTSDLKKVVPNGERLDSDTLLTIFSESSMQLQRQGPLNVRSLHLIFEDLTTRGIQAITSTVNAGLLENVNYLSLERQNIACLPATYLGADATALIAEMLQSGKMPKLRSLQLSGFDFKDEVSLNSLKLALQCSRTFKKRFFKSSSNQHIGDITEAMESEQMSHLDLKNNNLGVEGAVSIVKAMSFGRIRRVKHLFLVRNNIGDQGAIAIAGAFTSGRTRKLRELDLSDNGIGDEGIIALVKALKYVKVPSLESLWLGANAIGDEGMLYIADALDKGAFPAPLRILDVFSSKGHREISTTVLSALLNAYKNNKQQTLRLISGRGLIREGNIQIPQTFLKNLDSLQNRNEEWATTAEALRKDPQVLATHAKAFFCGRARVGKTTLRQTLEKTENQDFGRWHFRRWLTILFRWHKKSSLEPTRGIEVSHIHGGARNAGKFERRLAIWDLAGQREFEALHSSFVPDIGLADGSGTFFVIVCSENMPSTGNSPHIHTRNAENTSTSSFARATKDLLYWLKFIASHSSTSTNTEMERGQDSLEIRRVRKVFVVINCFNGKKSDQDQKKRWQRHLYNQHKEFKDSMDLSVEPHILDATNITQVAQLATLLDDEVKKMLEQHKVPRICQDLSERCAEWVEDHRQYPVLQWDEYCRAVGLKSDASLEAATNYLHETGHLVWFKGLQGSSKSSTEGGPGEGNQDASELKESSERRFSKGKSQTRKSGKAAEAVHSDGNNQASHSGESSKAGLEVDRKASCGVVVMSPEYFCQRVVGRLLLPDDMLRQGEENLKATYMDPSDDSLPLATIAKEHFDVEAHRCEEMVQILQRLGLAFSHRDDQNKVYIPAVIEKKDAPGWFIDTCRNLRGGNSWMIGFSLKPQHPERNLLPVRVLRQLQVDLAYDRQIGRAQDSEFSADVSQIWFKWRKMGVLVEYSAPAYVEHDRLDVLVIPLTNSISDLQRQAQVDVAYRIVQRAQLLATECCPGLKLDRWIIKPWSCAEALNHKLIDRVTMKSAEVIYRMENDGVDGGLNWTVGNTLVKYADILAAEDFHQMPRSARTRVDLTKTTPTQLGVCDFPENFPGKPKEVDAQARNTGSDGRVRASRARAEPQTALVLDAVEERIVGMEERLSSQLKHIKESLLETSEHQESLNRHMLSLEEFLVQDKEKSVPRFAYVATLEGRKKFWAKVTKGCARKCSLHFLCEAGFSDGKLHKVKQQSGVKITKLEEWVKVLIPLLDWTLKLAFVAAKIANGAVLPGLSILFRDDDLLRNILNSSSQIANGTSDLGKFFYEQFPLDPGPSNATIVSMENDKACRGEALDFLREILPEYGTMKFQKKVGLRKVKFCGSACKDKNIVAWICNPCFDEYGPDSVTDIGSSCK